MTMNRREQVLLLVVGATVLYGVTSLLIRPRIDLWKELRNQQALAKAELAADKELVDEEERWRGELTELSSLLPLHPADRRMDVHWLSAMDSYAVAHGLRILRRRVNDEEQIGELYELPIEVSEWEGTLESLVRFLYALQSSDTMLDVRQLLVRPAKGELLRGRFLLYAAYSREEPQP